MDKTSLVLCKQGFKTETENFNEGTIYRCCIIEDQFLVYGVVFDKEHFEKFFDFAHDVVMKEFTDIGLVKDGRPVSMSKLKEIIDVHKYKFINKRGYLYVGFAYFQHPKTLTYQFASSFASDTKLNLFKEILSRLDRICKGEVDDLDSDMDNIIRGNSGVALSHADVYWRATKEKVEL